MTNTAAVLPPPASAPRAGHVARAVRRSSWRASCRALGAPAIAALIASLVAACGGGTDGTGHVGGPDNGVTSSGVMTLGSVIVNETTFDASRARVTDDRGRNADQLANGMVIKLRGRSNDASTSTGSAEQIDVENDLRAPIASIDRAANPPRFVAAGTPVVVDSRTVYANVANFDALAVGMRVEVHGLRDADGIVRASRIEAVGTAGADEARGRVTAVDMVANRVTLDDRLTVTYTGATFAPAGTSESSLVAGALVEVRGAMAAGSTFTANQVDIEALEDAAYAGATGEKQEVEGFVTAFAAHPGEFRVNGRTVRTTAATQFDAGTGDDLFDNVWVEIEGAIDAQGVLVADRVKFKLTRIVLQGLATVVDLLLRTLGLLGQTVEITDLTRIIGGVPIGLGDIIAGLHCVDVRGYVDGTRIVAERVNRQPSCARSVVQSRVTSKNNLLSSLTFFGGLTALTLPTTQYLDPNGLLLTRDEFFTRVTAANATSPGTLVRVQGTYAIAAFTVESAQIRD